jgi:hypothetical protein
VPVVESRANCTPCQSGDTSATGRSRPGSWEIGKTVPENRNSGSTPTRMITGNETSLSSPTE